MIIEKQNQIADLERVIQSAELLRERCYTERGGSSFQVLCLKIREAVAKFFHISTWVKDAEPEQIEKLRGRIAVLQREYNEDLLRSANEASRALQEDRRVAQGLLPAPARTAPTVRFSYADQERLQRNADREAAIAARRERLGQKN